MYLQTNEIIVRESATRIREDMGELQELADSIKAHGQIEPIVITENNELIAGGRRLEACKLLGIGVECVRKKDVTDIQLREMELEENIQRKDLDFVEKAKLIKEIDQLKKKQFGAAVGGRGADGWSLGDTANLLGKSKATISRSIDLADAIELFPQIGEAKNEAEAKKLLRKIEEGLLLKEISKRQIEKPTATYQFAADAYQLNDVMQGVFELPDGSFDIAEVDSPYGIDLVNQKRTKQVTSELKTAANYTEWSVDRYKKDIQFLAIEVYKKLKNDSWCIWWYGQEHQQFVCDMLKAAGFQIDKIPAIWSKGRGQTNQPELYLARTYEVFIIARKGNPVMWKRGRSNVFDFPRANDRIHPTEKPIPLLLELLDIFAQQGQKLLVPFLGSGNTLRAAYIKGLTGLGFELDKELKTKFLLRVADDIEAKLYK